MNRIELLASLSKGSLILCDIGCDHAHVLIEALQKYGVERGIAADIAEGPLSQAKIQVQNAKLSDKVIFKLSDGFDKINEKFDTAVIAGMGGILIKSILSKKISSLTSEKLILEPNSDAPILRKFLFENGFSITEEYAIYDSNKYYEIMVVKKGAMQYDELDIEFGPILRRNKNEAFIKNYTNKYNKLKEILKNIDDPKKKEEKCIEFRLLNSLLCKGIMINKPILYTKNYYSEYFIDDNPRPLVVIVPGGAYLYASPRESAPVVKVFNNYGYHCVVVKYREDLSEHYPIPSDMTAEVIRLMHLDKRVTKIIGLGFSAGGHNILDVAVNKDKYPNNVDLLILGYPVVTTNKEYWHKNSFENLLGDRFNDEKLLESLSLENRLTNNMPDLFLWTTLTDKSVSPYNSIILKEKYISLGNECEFHTFPFCPHGMSVANEDSAEGDMNKVNIELQSWIELANNWLIKKLK